VIANPSDSPFGGCMAWQLPFDETAAGAARRLLVATMTALRLPRDLVGDAALMVSELATNAWQHGRGPGRRPDGSARPPVPCPPEL
jgi:anti-sigma regulatory factor (Ser/Thr protein kinase)